MAAATKPALLEISRKEFARLTGRIATVSADQATAADDQDTTIKDVIAHRAHWIGLFLGWYADGQAGKTVAFPAPGYRWNDLKRYNADLRSRQRHIDWPRAVRDLHDANDRLMAFVEGCSEADLYQGPMRGANNAWTTGRWAEAVGPSHFRSATKYLAARLRSIAA